LALIWVEKNWSNLVTLFLEKCFAKSGLPARQVAVLSFLTTKTGVVDFLDHDRCFSLGKIGFWIFWIKPIQKMLPRIYNAYIF
jgi:hypothetical protein